MTGTRWLTPLWIGARRTRARGGRFALVLLALTAAGGIVGMSSVVGAVSLFDTVTTKLAATDPGARSIVARERVSPTKYETRPELIAAVTRFSDVTEAPIVTHVFDPVAPPDARGTKIITTDALTRTIRLTSGRTPVPCPPSASECEVASTDPTVAPGDTIALPTPEGGSISARVVGVGTLTSDVSSARALAGPRALVVPQVAGTPLATVLESSGATVLVSAPLDPAKVTPGDLQPILDDVRVATTTLQRVTPNASLGAPGGLLSGLIRLGSVSSTRLLLIAGQGAGLVLAFAAFVASIVRRDDELGRAQLADLSAGRGQLALVRATESLLPALSAFVLVVVGLRLALLPVASHRSAASDLVGAALPWHVVGLIAALELVAAAILFFAASGSAPARAGIGRLELLAVAALALVLWQGVTSGGFDPDAIRGGASTQPVLLLVPGLTVLVAGVALLHALPSVFRFGERRTRRGAPSTRLAMLAAARNPAGAAAVTTFLAVAVGGAIFGLNYSATLERQAVDEASFVVGAAGRATFAGSPTVGPGAAPGLRLSGLADNGTPAGLPVEIVGLPAASLHDVSGWRSSFAAESLPAIGSALRPHAVDLAGPTVPSDASAIRITARDDTTDERTAVVHLLLPTGQFETISLGTLTAAWHTLETPLPAQDQGARVVGLEFPVTAGASTYLTTPGAVVGNITSSEASVSFADLAIETTTGWQPVEGIADWQSAHVPALRGSLTAVTFDNAPVKEGFNYKLNATAVPLLRPEIDLARPGGVLAGPPQPANGTAQYVVPALAGPAASAAALDGSLDVDILGEKLRMAVVADAQLFPTVVDTPTSFLVVDYATLFAALNIDSPGLATATEAWYFAAVPPAAPPGATLVRRSELQRELLTTPLAHGTRMLLLVSGAAAAALAVLAMAVAMLSAVREESRELAEYEAMGVSPRVLARSLRRRLVMMSVAGVTAGVLGGLVSVALIGALVAVTASGGAALPPVATVIAWAPSAGVVAFVLGAASLLTAVLVGVRLRSVAAWRLRE